MRNNLIFGLFAVAAMAFVSCSKENELSIPEQSGHYVTFSTGTPETKTAITLDGTTYSAVWTSTDADNIHVYENGVEGIADVTLSDENKKATFKVLFDGTPTAPFTYTAILAGSSWYDLNTKIASIPYAQAPAANNIDGNADILVAKPIERTTQPGSNEEIHFQFKRIVSVNKMTVKGLEVGDQVTKVTISGDKNITADYSFENDALDYSTGLDEIELTYAANNVVGSAGTFDVYFICAPVEDATLAIKVETNNHTYEKTFTKTISFDLETVAEFVANVTCCESVSGGSSNVEIFNESFDGCDGTGGRDNSFSGSIASSSYSDATMATEPGWTMSNVKAAKGCIKVGSSSTGSATTKAIGITQSSATITFDAALWNNKDEKYVIVLSLVDAPEGAAISPTEFTLEKSTWNNYSATITNADENTKVKFTEKQTTTRFFLDNIIVSEERTNDPNTVSLTVAENTEINGSATEATIEISSNKAWKVTSTDELLEGAPIKIEGTAQTTSFTVNFAEANASVTEAKVAHLTVVAGAGTYAVTKEITVTQKAVTPYINLDNKTLTAEASATSATFTVTGCNFDWDVVSVTVDGASNPSYTATKGENGVVTVTFPSNAANGATTLDKTIVVTVGDSDIKTNTCTITQAGETYVDPNKRYYIAVTESLSDWSGNYLIVSGNKALPANNITGKSHTPTTVSVAGGMIEATNDVKKLNVAISAGSVSGKWYMHGLTGYYGDGGSSGSFAVSETGIDNEISYDEGFSIKSGSNYLRLNSGYFRYYQSATQGDAITLYKYNGSASELLIGQLVVGDISCTNNGQSTSSLTFSWDAVTGAVKYMVSADGGEYADNGTATTCTLSGLEPNTSHSISVKAIGDGVLYTDSEPKTSETGTTKDNQGGGDTTPQTVKYTVTSTSAVSVSGTAPDGSSATYSSTSNTKCQLTANNSMTLTLNGFSGKKITGLVLSMKSNTSNGAGYMSMTAGSNTLASIGSSSNGINFNNASWYGAWSTSYVDITVPVTATTVGNSESVVITIGATVNSLYCESFEISYE